MNILQLAKQTFMEWNDDQAPRLGAGLAFYSVLSMGPLLLIIISVAGLVFGRDAASTAIISEIRNLVGKDGGNAITDVLLHSHNEAKNILATVIGIVTLFISATGFFGQLQGALNTIFKVPKLKTGYMDFIKKRILSFAMIVGICVLLLFTLVISTGLSAVTAYFHDSAPALFAQVLSFTFSFVVTTLLFAMAFKVMPDVHIQWRHVWIGAIITALLFAVGKSLIALYLGRSAFSSTYGAAGSLIVLLVWIYYSTQIIFLGAEFTQVYARAMGAPLPLKKGLVPVTAKAIDNREVLATDSRVPMATPVSSAVPATATTEDWAHVLTLTVAAGVLLLLRKPKSRVNPRTRAR